MEINEFINNFKDAIELPSSVQLTPESVFRDEIEGWDSLSGLMIITMIKSEYDVAIKADEFIQCQTMLSLFDKVKSIKNA